MIIPVACFSCGKIVGDKWEKYTRLIQQEALKHGGLTDNIYQNIFKQLDLSRMCCRRMIVTHVDIIDRMIYNDVSRPLDDDYILEKTKSVYCRVYKTN